MADKVILKKDRYDYFHTDDKEILEMTIPIPPSFEEDMEIVAKKAEKLVTKFKIPKYPSQHHPLIAKLLKKDEIRQQKYSWANSTFDHTFEKRRLKILSCLFKVAERCGMKPSVHDQYGRELYMDVGDSYVNFTLDSMSADKQIQREKAGYCFIARGERDKMRLQFSSSSLPENLKNLSWKDTDKNKVEDHLSEIIEYFLIAGEACYREHVIWQYNLLVERKANVEKKEQDRKEAEEKARQERQEMFEKQRLDSLLEQATHLRQANEIRNYVEIIRQSSLLNGNLTKREFNEWSVWALRQADRIDPVKSKAYKKWEEIEADAQEA